jgi:hypothetical protein
MRLKILLNLGDGLPEYKEDQVVEEKNEEMANQLIRMGVALELPPVRVADEITNQPETTTESKPGKLNPKNKE